MEENHQSVYLMKQFACWDMIGNGVKSEPWMGSGHHLVTHKKHFKLDYHTWSKESKTQYR